MSLQPPAEAAWVLELLDVDWPEVDEDGLRALADAYREYAEDLTWLTRRAGHAAARILDSAAHGPSAAAFGARWARFDASGSGHLPDAAAVARIMAGALDTAASVVSGAKAAIAAYLVTCAARLTATPGRPLGMADAAAHQAVQTAREAIGEILAELDRSVGQVATEAVRGSAISALKAMASDLTGSATGLRTGS